MEPKPTKAELRARMEATSQTMSERLAALQDDLQDAGTSAADEVRTRALALRDQARHALRRRPLWSLGGAVAAGLAVGFLATRGRRDRLKARHRRLVEQYVDAVREDVVDAVARGRTADDAVTDALRNRVPFVIYEAAASDGDGAQRAGLVGALGSLVAFALRTVLREVFDDLLQGTDFASLLGLRDALSETGLDETGLDDAA
jgi:ElaB/YqjD/DUF883 family membrane-anchored ribosome-binding protein